MIKKRTDRGIDVATDSRATMRVMAVCLSCLLILLVIQLLPTPSNAQDQGKYLRMLAWPSTAWVLWPGQRECRSELHIYAKEKKSRHCLTSKLRSCMRLNSRQV